MASDAMANDSPRRWRRRETHVLPSTCCPAAVGGFAQEIGAAQAMPARRARAARCGRARYLLLLGWSVRIRGPDVDNDAAVRPSRSSSKTHAAGAAVDVDTLMW